MKARIPGAQQGGTNNMMKKIQEMQENMENVQKEVEATEFTSSVGGGTVEVTVNGAHEVTAVSLKPEVVDPEDVEMLQDLIISAFNESIRKANEAMEKGMEQAKGGLSIPGLF
ncbi:MAG: YbaB/EbfC family nucleoid-associated protein [Clostridia bacterium]|nr:YbaB/EbfC family nucleoid-associated protein [Clostridia bacterium]